MVMATARTETGELCISVCLEVLLPRLLIGTLTQLVTGAS